MSNASEIQAMHFCPIKLFGANDRRYTKFAVKELICKSCLCCLQSNKFTDGQVELVPNTLSCVCNEKEGTITVNNLDNDVKFRVLVIF